MLLHSIRLPKSIWMKIVETFFITKSQILCSSYAYDFMDDSFLLCVCVENSPEYGEPKTIDTNSVPLIAHVHSLNIFIFVKLILPFRCGMWVRLLWMHSCVWKNIFDKHLQHLWPVVFYYCVGRSQSTVEYMCVIGGDDPFSIALHPYNWNNTIHSTFLITISIAIHPFRLTNVCIYDECTLNWFDWTIFQMNVNTDMRPLYSPRRFFG